MSSKLENSARGDLQNVKCNVRRTRIQLPGLLHILKSLVLRTCHKLYLGLRHVVFSGSGLPCHGLRLEVLEYKNKSPLSILLRLRLWRKLRHRNLGVQDAEEIDSSYIRKWTLADPHRACKSY